MRATNFDFYVLVCIFHIQVSIYQIVFTSVILSCLMIFDFSKNVFVTLFDFNIVCLPDTKIRTRTPIAVGSILDDLWYYRISQYQFSN